MLGSGLEGPCHKVETWVGILCNNISPYSPQPWTACIPPTSKDSHMLLACMFLHGCPLVLITSMPTCTFSHGFHLDPPTWMHSPSPSLHLCPPAFPHTDMSCPPTWIPTPS